MENINLVLAFAPAFAAGFALQRLLEILDPILDYLKNGTRKKVVLGLISLAGGLGLARWPNLRVLRHLMPNPAVVPTFLDYLVTGLIVSGGTEGFNAIMKFMNYKKEETKEAAAKEAIAASREGTLMRTEAAMKKNSTSAERDVVLFPWQCDSIVYDCVRKITQSTRPFDRNEPLQRYSVNSPEQRRAIASLVVGDSEVGVGRYGFQMSINSIKDLNSSWTMGQTSDRIQSSATPIDIA